jgi:hypothetical protein
LTRDQSGDSIRTIAQQERPVSPILLEVVFIVLIALFAFQLWRVWQTGHVRWRAQKHHRDHRPVAFWLEIASCVVGLLLCAGLLAMTLLDWWPEGG